ncbi:hypothetical protein J6590_065054 [Homalodisca vitripennis]|nr:hypothetical protein J6590_065054 [Homalodisca vitripennis]
MCRDELVLVDYYNYMGDTGISIKYTNWSLSVSGSNNVVCQFWSCRAVTGLLLLQFVFSDCDSAYMTEAKIDQYFSPLARNSKRQRPSTSPDTAGEELMDANTKDEKVGDITHGQLMAGLSGLLDQKLSKLATKDDLVNLSRQVKELADGNKMLKDAVVRLQLQEKKAGLEKNNLIFRGLKWTEKIPDYKQLLLKFCREMLGCGDRLWVNRAHLLGKDGNAVIAHLPEDADVHYIMSRSSSLKGTGYTVHRDFPMEVRYKRSCLAAVRSEVEHVAGRMRMPLAFDHLTINSTRFTWEDGKLMEGQRVGADQLKTLFSHSFIDYLDGLRERAPRQQRQAGAPRPERCEYGNDDCESRCRGPSSRRDGDEHWTGCEHHRGLRGICRSCIRGGWGCRA